MRIMLFGTFDVLHPGHLQYLHDGERRGEMVVVIARDENVRRIKGLLPEHDENTRKAAVEKEFPEATVVLGNPDDFLTPIREHAPDVILLGYDQHLPPGINEKDLPPIERAEPLEPEKYKSSLLRKNKK
jgi:FAD synthetase